MVLLVNHEAEKDRLPVLWAVPVPDLAPLPLDLNPVAAEVRTFERADGATRLRRLADEFARGMSTNRLVVTATIKDSLAMVARAELDGWNVDVDSTLASLRANKASFEEKVNELKATIRREITRLHAASGPGRNTLYASRDKIFKTVDDISNDLDDYVTEYEAVKARMAIYKSAVAPIDRAANAYEYAFRKVFGDDIKTTKQIEQLDGATTLRLSVSLNDSDLLSDAARLLALESNVHDLVGVTEEGAIGKIAIDYLSA